ncbi:DUF5723 family protein [Galbibacter mesophilus]|uniref:DUF5723 family protein n=1 Tax=Galbibacter mesophilus TaxID=379069 RepID=UPI00191EA5AC|nr:DUF5723 family protein [Galbibacter mesophilus]MCM5661755.1 DUF5723 family protein [Galbibacter mesophilus]
MLISRWVLYLAFFTGTVSIAQNKQLLYNFTDIPQSIMVNPAAELNAKAYFGIPALSGIYVHAGSSNVSVYDLFLDDGVDFNTKVENIIYRLGSNDVQRINEQVEILNIGFKLGGRFSNSFLSFGVYQEADFFNYWPKDLSILAYEGNSPNIGNPFRLDHLNVKGELLTVFHVGFQKKINDKFTYGFRAKIYSSMVDFTSTKNSGTFTTTLGEDNFYRHTLLSNVEVKTSGLTALTADDVDGTGDVLGILRNRALFGGNLGIGFDAGVTYTPNENWTYTASLLDLGVIFHSKDVERYTLNGAYSLEGIELPFDDIFTNGGIADNWQDLVDEIEAAFPRDTLTSAYTTFRPIKLNTAAIYNFGRQRSAEDCSCMGNLGKKPNSIGMQLYLENRPKSIEAALTAFYYRRLGRALNIKTTYTVDRFSKTNIGLGLSTHFANFNFYLLADNLIEYANLAKANNASLQLGFNYIFPY